MHKRTAAVTVASILSLGPAALRAQAPGAMTPDQGWSAISQCASNPTERARHACVDDVLRKAGLLTPQAEAKERRRQFGLDENAARAAPPVAAPKPPPSPAPAPASAAPPKNDDSGRVEVEVARAAVATDGKVVVTTTDGAQWKQTDSDTLPRLPAAGDRVKIRRASLGSYLCELPTHHTFRCVRTK